MKVEGQLFKKKKEPMGGMRGKRKDNGGVHDQSIPYAYMKMSQWNLVFCIIKIC
jgi:hypothetical protein